MFNSKKVLIISMSGLLGSVLMADGPHKIIAREVVRVNQYDLRQDEPLCRGIAMEIANGYLSLGIHSSIEEYCKKEAKKRAVYPASSCSIEHMTFECKNKIQDKQKE